jgi:hypothetical protein
VHIADQNGCTATASLEFTVLTYVFLITQQPNGDGTGWRKITGCTNNYPDLNALYFDRYGRVIATDRDRNGTVNGEEFNSLRLLVHIEIWITIKMIANQVNIFTFTDTDKKL